MSNLLENKNKQNCFQPIYPRFFSVEVAKALLQPQGWQHGSHFSIKQIQKKFWPDSLLVAGFNPVTRGLLAPCFNHQVKSSLYKILRLY